MIPGISIARIHDPDVALSTVLALTEQHLEDVRHRAFDYFQERGRTVGNDWEDWLRAERKMLWRPRAEMFENRSTLVLRVAVPGFSHKSIQVTATPHSLLIQGTESHQHEDLDARLHFCEFGRHLFRRFDLPSLIDPSTVSATLDKGVLEILAGIGRRPHGAQHLQART